MKFNEFMQGLELMFGPCEQDPDRRNDKISVYYDRLKFTSERILDRAAKHLIDVHQYKRFPLVQEARDAIDQVSKQVSDPVFQEEREDTGFICEVCHGTGHVLRDAVEENGYQHVVAKACQCKEGLRVEARWKHYFEKKRQEAML